MAEASEPKFAIGDWLDWDMGWHHLSGEPLRVISVERDAVQGRRRYRLDGLEYPVYEEVLSLTEHVVCPTPAERRAAMDKAARESPAKEPDEEKEILAT